jgi:hypothetical protein
MEGGNEMPEPGEVQWHMTESKAPATAETLIIVTVALMRADNWMALATAIPWLGRHCLQTEARWRIWNYFCARNPHHLTVDVPRGISCESWGWVRGVKHGVCTESLSIADWKVGLYFAGQLANCGRRVPAKVKVFDISDGTAYIELDWNRDFAVEKGDVVQIVYTDHLDAQCPFCADCNVVGNVFVNQRDGQGTLVCSKYDILCRNCKRADPPCDAELLQRLLGALLPAEENDRDSVIQRYVSILAGPARPQPKWAPRRKRRGHADDHEAPAKRVQGSRVSPD